MAACLEGQGRLWRLKDDPSPQTVATEAREADQRHTVGVIFHDSLNSERDDVGQRLALFDAHIWRALCSFKESHLRLRRHENVKIDSPEGVSSINGWLKTITPPNQVLRRQQDGCYALLWTNPNLPDNPAHLVIDVHYTDSGYSLGHCFVNGWEGSLDMSSPLRKAKVAPGVPAKSANGRWPDDPTHTITGGWGPQIPENTNWTVREH